MWTGEAMLQIQLQQALQAGARAVHSAASHRTAPTATASPVHPAMQCTAAKPIPTTTTGAALKTDTPTLQQSPGTPALHNAARAPAMEAMEARAHDGVRRRLQLSDAGACRSVPTDESFPSTSTPPPVTHLESGRQRMELLQLLLQRTRQPHAFYSHGGSSGFGRAEEAARLSPPAGAAGPCNAVDEKDENAEQEECVQATPQCTQRTAPYHPGGDDNGELCTSSSVGTQAVSDSDPDGERDAQQQLSEVTRWADALSPVRAASPAT